MNSLRGHWLGAGLLVVCGVLVATLLMRDELPRPAYHVPDPDTTEMQAPVVQLIGQSRSAVIRESESADAWGKLGAVFDAHRLYRDAASCYARAHQLDPAEFRWMYFLAIVDDYNGASIETTIDRLRAAVDLKPDYAPLYVRFGDVLVRDDRRHEARVAYEKALQLAPGFPTAHRGLGQVLLGLGDVDAAIDHLEQATRLHDGDRGTYAALARAYRLRGEVDRAREAAEKSSRGRNLYGYLDRERGYVGKLGVSSTVAIGRARFHLMSGDFAAAIEDLKLVEQHDPDDEWVHHQLARAYSETGRPDLAAKHLAEARRLSGEQ